MSDDVIRDMALLRKPFREQVEALLGMLAKEAIDLQVYETVRSPLRQSLLYAVGRVETEPHFGRTVTGARPYESAHQFGLAVDFAFHPGKWSWIEPEFGLWARMHELAKVAELETLRKEQPHVQIPNFDHDKATMTRGPTYVTGWLEWVKQTSGG